LGNRSGPHSGSAVAGRHELRDVRAPGDCPFRPWTRMAVRANNACRIKRRLAQENAGEPAQVKRKRGRPLTPRDLEVFSRVLAALRGDYGEETRRLVKDFIATWDKAWTLRRKGHTQTA
jgi:hypothetical protein